jgi:hypothetical protein
VGGEALFAPLNIMEVVESKWAGHNPMITESNVRSLDVANGGGYSGRLAGAPPQFRPVGSYESGKPIFALGNRGRFGFGNDGPGSADGGMPDSPSPRRGGLFGFLRGR